MKHKTTAVRLLGGLLMAVALLPWLGGAAAQAAVNVHLDTKWIGTSAQRLRAQPRQTAATTRSSRRTPAPGGTSCSPAPPA